jgi:hypothetical protein
MAAPARLAFVVATDRFDTIRSVVDHLRAQTIAGQIELVIASPEGEALPVPEDAAAGLAAVRLVEARLEPLSAARAVGVEAATAELVYIGETHVYPRPDWAERLVAAHDAADWFAVVPRLTNANPRRALSQASLALDYGMWGGASSRPLDRMPGSNVVIRRTALCAEPGALAELLRPEELATCARDRGGIYHAADAEILHLNVSRPASWLHERFLAGRLVGGSRAKRFGWGRRLAYALAAPVIAVVLAARVMTVAGRPSPPVALLVVAGAGIQAAGEAVGYLAGGFESAERRMQTYELDKARYALP